MNVHDGGGSSLGMTEEEAMRIWRRGDREPKDSHLLRQRHLRMQEERARELRASELQPPLGGLGEPVQHRFHTTNIPLLPRAERFGSGEEPSPNDALHRNAASPRALLHHNAQVARRRPTDIRNTGVDAAHALSEAELERLIEERREATRRIRAEPPSRGTEAVTEALLIEEQYCRAFLDARQRRIVAEQAGSSATHNRQEERPPPRAGALSAQQREYERLTQANQERDINQQYISPHFLASFASKTNISGYSHNSDKKRNGSSISNDSEKKHSAETSVASLAAPKRTEFLTQPVTCPWCFEDQFTHSTANACRCHYCFQFFILQRDTMGNVLSTARP